MPDLKVPQTAQNLLPVLFQKNLFPLWHHSVRSGHWCLIVIHLQLCSQNYSRWIKSFLGLSAHQACCIFFQEMPSGENGPHTYFHGQVKRSNTMQVTFCAFCSGFVLKIVPMHCTIHTRVPLQQLLFHSERMCFTCNLMNWTYEIKRAKRAASKRNKKLFLVLKI